MGPLPHVLQLNPTGELGSQLELDSHPTPRSRQGAGWCHTTSVTLSSGVFIPWHFLLALGEQSVLQGSKKALRSGNAGAAQGSGASGRKREDGWTWVELTVIASTFYVPDHTTSSAPSKEHRFIH